MTNTLQYITDFSKSRSKKIGASEIAACIPHPEKMESVAGWGQTAISVWEEKTGRRERDPAGFAAEMGHVLEPVIIRKWLQENTETHQSGNAEKYPELFYRSYILCELSKKNDGYPDAKSFQVPPFLHHTKSETDFSIAHADCIGPDHGVIIEAKSASFWSSRRGDDPYNGYDTALKGKQGIPLKNYFQLQFQAANYNLQYGIEFKKLYLALLFDTSQFCTWEILPDKKVMETLLEIASLMKKCIDKDTPPKELAMNASDIKKLYPTINEDYRVLSGDDLSAAIDLSKVAIHAAKQKKQWEKKQRDAESALTIILKDTKTVKGIINGQIKDIATWQERKESEKIMSLSDIKKLEYSDRVMKYLKANDLLTKTEGSRFVKIKLKEVEDEV